MHASASRRSSSSSSALAAAAAYFSLFIVHMNEQAHRARFGEPVRIISEPGLYWKIPVVQTVDISTSASSISTPQPQEVTASDQKRLVVDTFARYRIVDPLLFYQTRALTRRACARASARSSNRRCAACSAASTFQDVVRDKREDADEAHRQPGQRGGQGVRPPGRRRAHQARRSARAELQEHLRPHARRAPARGGRVPRRGRRRSQPHPGRLPIARSPSSRPRRRARASARAATATPSATASSPRPTAAIPDFFGFYRSMQAYEQGIKSARHAHAARRPTASSSSTSPTRTAEADDAGAQPQAMSDLVVGVRAGDGDRGPAVGGSRRSWRSAAGGGGAARRSTRCVRRVAAVGVAGFGLVWLIRG